MVHVFNLSTSEAETSISLWVQSQPSPQNKFQASQGYRVKHCLKKRKCFRYHLCPDDHCALYRFDRELSTSQLLSLALVRGCQNNSLCLHIVDVAQDTQGHARMLLENGSKSVRQNQFYHQRVDAVIRGYVNYIAKQNVNKYIISFLILIRASTSALHSVPRKQW